MYRIDLKKLKEELLHTKPTLYCSIMAYLRGKLHMSRVNGGTIYWTTKSNCWEWFGYNNEDAILDERRHMFRWTKEDQKELAETFLYKHQEEYEVKREAA
jgi:hypothetical protein